MSLIGLLQNFNDENFECRWPNHSIDLSINDSMICFYYFPAAAYV